MLKLFITSSLLFGFLFINSNAADYLKEAPSYLPSCKFSDPNYKKCGKNQMTQIFKQLNKEGIPGLKSVPKIDPFHIEKLKFNQGANSVVLKLILTNVIVTKLDTIQIDSSYINNKTLVWHVKVSLPKVRLDADYDMDGRILILPLKGVGQLYLELENFKANVKLFSKIFERDDIKFFNMTGITSEITNVSGMKSYLKNLFNGNTELEKSTNEFLNENWRDFYEALKPLIQQTVEEIILDICQKMYKYIPAKYVIEDI